MKRDRYPLTDEEIDELGMMLSGIPTKSIRLTNMQFRRLLARIDADRKELKELREATQIAVESAYKWARLVKVARDRWGRERERRCRANWELGQMRAKEARGD